MSRERGIRLLYLLALMGLLMACTPQALPPTLTPPAVLAKRLATVYLSPTPDAAQQQATQQANPATNTPLPALPTPTATAYVGVFLGEAEAVSDSGPIINLTQLSQPTLPSVVTIAATCPSPVDAVFGGRWSEDALIEQEAGCPIEALTVFQGTMQIFERGVMYFRPDTNEIWAIDIPGQRYWSLVNVPPVQPGDIVVPEGMMAPSLGFGAVWRGVPGVQDALGFARQPETNARLSLQKLQNATLFLDGSSGQVFVLLTQNRLRGPY